MLGGGVACYAILGWWSDLALPGGCESDRRTVSGDERADVRVAPVPGGVI
jgi:hypothetical protein